MTRILYSWLIAAHPSEFRIRFGAEMRWIFDEIGVREKPTLFADALRSLLRQWVLRSALWKVLVAFAGAALQIAVTAMLWMSAMARIQMGTSPQSDVAAAPGDGMYLLLIAGVLAALLMGMTILAVWIGRFGIRRTAVTAGWLRVFAVAPAIMIGLCGVSTVHAQPAPARPAFEVTSVRANGTGCANGRGGGGQGAPPAGRLSVKCITIRDLIQAAYGTFGDGTARSQRILQVMGAPGWVDTDNYDIEAKPAGRASVEQMYGPMLAGLLEDRFRLKIHRETKQLPVYVLTVAARGLIMRPTEQGSCTPIDLNHPTERSSPAQAVIPNCGRTGIRRTGKTLRVDAYGVDMAMFAGTILSARLDLDRPVIDKTGLQGMFDIHLEIAADPAATQGIDIAPSIFTALQEQLGLKLSPDKGPIEVLVVDHIEKASAN